MAILQYIIIYIYINNLCILYKIPENYLMLVVISVPGCWSEHQGKPGGVSAGDASPKRLSSMVMLQDLFFLRGHRC